MHRMMRFVRASRPARLALYGAAYAALGLPLAPRRASAQMPPEETIKKLTVAEGLEATVFASEPMILKPANMDVDARGRVWVTEGVNYRKYSNPPLRKEGDRIVILEDTRGAGKADKATVFYQGTDINCALGVCVLGDHVIVSCSPNVFIFTDTQGVGHADKKEVFFTGVKGVQHDHGMHAFVFGPDGKLYFNFGNAGEEIHRPDGKPVVDVLGNTVIQGKKGTKAGDPDGVAYRQGMVFRCNPDGSEFEVIGNNFRNNYEVNVDSFGTCFQSDNDDDGNRGVRIAYVMEYGNFGYTDEMTGAGWSSKRTNLEKEIPARHWHLNDPGVVPNMIQTGAGSPTGLCVYEGKLLPPVFWNQVIHCDAGPNVVRSYVARPSGGGYTAEVVNILKSGDGAGERKGGNAGDRWFRPSDVCVAPDGSLMVSDWYDPGVGGHGMGDNKYPDMHGRVYRVAPPGSKYAVPRLDLSSAAGALQALASPNLATRYLAWTKLHETGAGAEEELLKLWKSDDARGRARALWLLTKIEGKGAQYVEAALKDPNPDIRITGLRAARQIKLDVAPLVRLLARDANFGVLRECALALHGSKASDMPGAWAELAARHDDADAGDRYFVEALGIGAAGRDTECLDAYLKKAGDWNTPGGRDVVWRTRGSQAPALLAKIILDHKTADADRPRYVRALDFLPAGDEKIAALRAMLDADAADKTLAVEALVRLKGQAAKVPGLEESVKKTLDARKGTPEFVELCEQLDLHDRDAELLELAVAHPGDSVGAQAARQVLRGKNAGTLLEAALSADVDRAAKVVNVLGNIADGSATPWLAKVVADARRDAALRQSAVRALARTRAGAAALIDMARKGTLPQDAGFAAGQELRTAQWKEVKEAAAALFPAPVGKDAKPLPPVAELVKRAGDPARGHAQFAAVCAKCHKVADEGIDFGPNLSEIGGKYGKDALYENVLNPSANIAFGYEGKTLFLKDKSQADGIIVSETPDEISLRAVTGIVTRYKKGDVSRTVTQKLSIMPEGLQQTMTHQEFVDLIEYMATLRKPAAPAGTGK